jgi:ATP-binding cassette subfamily B (MDR/TAP) protein 1
MAARDEEMAVEKKTLQMTPGRRPRKAEQLHRHEDDHGYGDGDEDEDGDGDGKKKVQAEAKQPTVALYQLFSFADGLDYLLMLLGTLGACVHGAAIPVFFIFFGKLIDAFGAHAGDPDAMAKEVAKVGLFSLSLSLSPFFSSMAMAF